ncbi:hypothetical protein J6590_071993 [Homalodisca vitripennis]|nr:hypothetical protein J6590_071993 [Homalodisca vitripennis]
MVDSKLIPSLAPVHLPLSEASRIWCCYRLDSWNLEPCSSEEINIVENEEAQKFTSFQHQRHRVIQVNCILIVSSERYEWFTRDNGDLPGDSDYSTPTRCSHTNSMNNIEECDRHVLSGRRHVTSNVIQGTTANQNRGKQPNPSSALLCRWRRRDNAGRALLHKSGIGI